MAKEAYEKYPCTYEEDLEILKREDLTFNQRNSVLFRSGEKEILLFFIKMTEKILPLFDMDFKVRNNFRIGLF
jgi:hypothetical protein